MRRPTRMRYRATSSLPANPTMPATATALNTYVDATVDSVTIGSDGLYLNLPGLGTAPLDYVLRIGKSAS